MRFLLLSSPTSTQLWMWRSPLSRQLHILCAQPVPGPMLSGTWAPGLRALAGITASMWHRHASGLFYTPPQKYKRESPTSWLSVIRRAGNALLLSQPQSISFVGLAPPPTRRICCLLDPRKRWGRETSQNTEGKYQAVSMRLNLIIRQFHRKFNFLSSSCFSHLMWADSGET